VAEHSIVVGIVALVVAYVAHGVLVVQPAKIYNHILHKTLHYLDFENHTLDNILPYGIYIYLNIFKYGNINIPLNDEKSLYHHLF